MGKEVVNQYQPSISEWFALISENKEAEAFRIEDNQKVDRLEYLYQKIGLPYERPNKLEATELTQPSVRFKKILKERGDELCAIRLVPKKEGLPKIRNRGLSIKECYENWYLKQDINPADYFAFICPHILRTPWSMIFIVKPKIIFGEIIEGLHCQLTQGTTEGKLLDFQFNYKNWTWSEEKPEAIKILKSTLDLIKTDSLKIQKEITEKLDIEFSHNILCGYFEAVVWPDGRIHYIDYNRLIPSFISDPAKISHSEGKLTGSIAYPGKATGKVKIAEDNNIGQIDFKDGDILVCKNTNVRYLPLMKKAGAIVTDKGSILSHAAIVARELKIPCLVDTKKATQILKDNQIVSVDCDAGVIKIN